MPEKPKRELTVAEKAANARTKAPFMTIFINGRQKKVRRPEYIEGQPIEDFVARNADPLWLHQNEMWELIADPGQDEICLDSPDDELFRA